MEEVKEEIEEHTDDTDDYVGFAICLIERLLQVYESELTPHEMAEIREIASDWHKNKEKQSDLREVQDDT